MTGLNAYLSVHEKGNKTEIGGPGKNPVMHRKIAWNGWWQGMKTKLQQWHFWVLFSSDLAGLSDDVRERETEGKCSVSGDLKIYPPNLLSMDRAVASLQQIQHSLIAHE